MNYATECLEQLQLHHKLLKQEGMFNDVLALEMTMHDLLVAQKFLIPSPGHMNVVARRTAMKFARLPYPICAFEYSCPEAREDGIKDAHVTTTKSTRRIALAYDCRKDVGPVPAFKASGLLDKDATGILVQSLFYIDKHKIWAPSFAAGYIDESMGENAEFVLDNKKLFFTVDALPLMMDSIVLNYGDRDKDQIILALLNDVAEELGMAVRACLLLNTRNLKVVKAIDAPTALNKKREKRGRPPFFEYHTLDIFVSEGGSRVFRKHADPNAVRKFFSNMHTERKWGTVIGHFKERKTGLFFWSDHTRGNKARGIVDKEYSVKRSV